MTKRKKPWDREKIVNNRKLTYLKGFPKQRILIVCEGEKTEPNYFKSFKVSSATVDTEGTGRNTMSLVQKADDLAKEAKRKGEKYDQVWCVFDKDSFSAENFNNAISQAESKKFMVGYSNEAFELWYLLHFIYFDTEINRRQYITKLDERLGYRYEKNSESIYDELLDKQETASRNAKRLMEIHRGKTPAASKPSTTVFMLVEELNKYK